MSRTESYHGVFLPKTENAGRDGKPFRVLVHWRDWVQAVSTQTQQSSLSNFCEEQIEGYFFELTTTTFDASEDRSWLHMPTRGRLRPHPACLPRKASIVSFPDLVFDQGQRDYPSCCDLQRLLFASHNMGLL